MRRRSPAPARQLALIFLNGPMRSDCRRMAAGVTKSVRFDIDMFLRRQSSLASVAPLFQRVRTPPELRAAAQAARQRAGPRLHMKSSTSRVGGAATVRSAAQHRATLWRERPCAMARG